MSKHGPMRLDPELLEEATEAAKRQKRSTRKQVEYWAELGRAVDGVVTRDQAAGIRTGLLVVTAPDRGPIDVDEVFSELEARRGDLSREVTRAPMRYQPSQAHPGMLERIDRDGRRSVGQFEGGEFRVRQAG